MRSYHILSHHAWCPSYMGTGEGRKLLKTAINLFMIDSINSQELYNFKTRPHGFTYCPYQYIYTSTTIPWLSRLWCSIGTYLRTKYTFSSSLRLSVVSWFVLPFSSSFFFFFLLLLSPKHVISSSEEMCCVR